MSQLATALEDAARARRRRAVRYLLTHPIVLAEREPEVFSDLRAEGEELGRWFADKLGWALHVDHAAGLARLYKRPAVPDATRPARRPGKAPFDRRRYVLLASALAALDASGGQTTLRWIADEIRSRMADDGLAPFDPDERAERLAFVDVLRFLEELGVLTARDGEADAYAQKRDSDALYDVRERVLAHLVAAPIPPALAESAASVATDSTYPDSDDGRTLRARHAVFRRLLEEPVVYFEELAPAERDYLAQAAGHVYAELDERAGLAVERRAEGIAGVDPVGEVTDDRFPDASSTPKHAALLLVEWFADLGRDGRRLVTHAECVDRTAELHRTYAERCNWAKAYGDGRAGLERLAADALGLLSAFALVRPRDGGWELRAALARFAPEAPKPGAGRSA